MRLRIEPSPSAARPTGDDAQRDVGVDDDPIEIVERKGSGHPDSICDAVAEELSRVYSSFCLEQFGRVLHHNVDKALLIGGASAPEFGGGTITKPISILLGGRATRSVGTFRIPIVELARRATRAVIARTFHALDPVQHVRVRALIRATSSELDALYVRSEGEGVPLAMDTSFGAASWPPTSLERAVLRVSDRLQRLPTEGAPHIGQDTKVMAVREDRSITLTVSCAFVSRHVRDIDDYVKKQSELERFLADEASAAARMPATVCVNCADDPSRGAGGVFLTVTGTSAEHGDDGQVGRGNRIGGTITPYRPMSLEAIAGKNPVSHVGKLYNVIAHRIARAIVDERLAVAADVRLVSTIGRPIDDPEIVDVRLVAPRAITTATRTTIDVIVRRAFEALPTLTVELVAGRVALW